MNERVILEIERRLERDHDALQRVTQSVGITKNPRLRLTNFSSIVTFFPDTPVTILKDVFEALQLYDLLELLEIKSAIKPHSSLQLANTLDEIKKLNGVADLPTTYHSCGAVLIITDDENVSSASAIKTFFTDLDNKSDVTEILTQEIPTLRHLNEEINVMILEFSARFGNLLEGEKKKQIEKSLLFYSPKLKVALDELKQMIRISSGDGNVRFRLMQLMSGISKVNIELKQVKTELWQTDELESFLESMTVTIERIQKNLTQLIQRSDEWFVIEEEKKKKNFQENVSAVTNRWIHRQG